MLSTSVSSSYLPFSSTFDLSPHEVLPGPPPNSPDTDVDPSSCSLLGPTALLVQALMGVFVILSLLVKRQYEGTKKGPVGSASASAAFAREQGDRLDDTLNEDEGDDSDDRRTNRRHRDLSSVSNTRSKKKPGRKDRRRRKWKVWMLDVGKQLIGQGCLHGSNLLISDQVSSHGDGNINPCSLYFLNILVDTTLGVLVLYACLKAITWLCIRFWDRKGFVSGEYGDPPKGSYFARQLLVYLLSILLMKLSVLLLFSWILKPFLLPIARWVLDWMMEWTQVVFVMAVFPLGMNVLQFCVIDSLIKAGNATSEEESSPEDREHGDDTHDDPKDDHRAPLLSSQNAEDGERAQTSTHRSSQAKRKMLGSSPGLSSALLGEYAEHPASPALSAGYGGTGTSNSGAVTPTMLEPPGGRPSRRPSGTLSPMETFPSPPTEADAIASELARITTTEANFGQWIDGIHQSSTPNPTSPIVRPGSGSTQRSSRLSDEMRGQARRTLSYDGGNGGDDRGRDGSHPLKNR